MQSKNRLFVLILEGRGVFPLYLIKLLNLLMLHCDTHQNVFAEVLNAHQG